MPDRPEPAEPDLRPVFDEFAARAGLATPTADLAGVRARAVRHRASAWAVAAAVAMVLAAPVGIYALVGHDPTPVRREQTAATPVPPDPVTPASPATSNAPAAVASAAPTPINAIDWANVTLGIPANQTGCAAGVASFRGAVAAVAGTTYHMGSGDLGTVEVGYGDVDADGQAEAILVISCVTPPGRKNPPSAVLLVSAKPSVHTMALAFSTSPRIVDGEGKSRIIAPAIRAGGDITFEVRTFEGNGQCQYHQRWTGTALTGACDP